MPDQLSEDVKTAVDSSQAAASGSEAPHTDAMDSSSESQAATHEDGKEQTMADAIMDQFKKSTAAEGSSPEGEAEKSGSENEQDKGEKAKEESEAKESTEKEEGTTEEKTDETEDKGPIPYERFQEVVHARQAVERELTESKPLVENYRRITGFCEQSGITPEQFNKALEIQALINSNPAEALKQLTPLVEQLKSVNGESLPQDLQKAVDDGDLPLEYAKRIAQAEAQRKLGETSFQARQQKAFEEQQKQFRDSLASAAQVWEQNKRTSDPDYAPKAKADDADGKWEMCRHVFTAMLHQVDDKNQLVNPVRNSQDMTALMEKAYKQVSQSFSRLTVKPPTRKSLTSHGSSKNNNKNIEDASTMQEAIQIALAQRG